MTAGCGQGDVTIGGKGPERQPDPWGLAGGYGLLTTGPQGGLCSLRPIRVQQRDAQGIPSP